MDSFPTSDYKIDSETFATQTLPQLALHYHREALKELEGKCLWLQTLTSPDPDWTTARDHFLTDGSGCINDLEKHIKLVRLAIANKALTQRHGLLFPIFMAQLYATIIRRSSEKTMWQDFGPRTRLQIREMQIKREKLSALSSTGDLVDSVDYFLEAAQQILKSKASETAEE